MDSHVLRRIGFELASQLLGARIETVYHPHSSIFVFKISKPALRPYLIFKLGREASCLLTSLKKPDNPPTPDAPTMRLRKYLCGRRVSGIWLDWAKNSLLLEFYPLKEKVDSLLKKQDADQISNSIEPTFENKLFLCLNMKLGPHLYSTLPEAAESLTTNTPPEWNIKEAVNSLENDIATQGKPWEKFPYLTPLLRKTLVLLDDPADKLALLVDLETGMGEISVYLPPSKSMPIFSAWPLPKSLPPSDCIEKTFDSALEALEQYANEPVFAQVNVEHTKTVTQELKRSKKRLLRTLSKLEQEEKHLYSLMDLKNQAMLIQIQLYSLNKEEKLANITLTDPSSGDEQIISLDPLKTVSENMKAMFKASAKGKRGLLHIEQRRKELSEQLEKLNQSNPDALALKAKSFINPKKSKPKEAQNSPGSQVSQHISPSGLTMLRGKNARGNREALKLASPYDIWLHAEGGPSAHLIIRLPHAVYNLLDIDLEMAASLVAEKSWQRNDRRATMICALAKDVHPIKGAAHGTVRVDKILRTITVNTPLS